MPSPLGGCCCRRGDYSDETPCLEVLVELVDRIVDHRTISCEVLPASDLTFDLGLDLTDLLLGCCRQVHNQP